MTRLGLSLALVATLALGACGGDDDDTTTGPPSAADLAGTYALRTYNGSALPLVVEQSATDGVLELTAGRVTLVADGTFSESMTFRLTPPGTGAAAQVDSIGSSGRYTATETQIVFTFPDGQRVTATHDDGTITVAGNGLTFVYRR